jgi:hypothetical protein
LREEEVGLLADIMPLAQPLPRWEPELFRTM